MEEDSQSPNPKQFDGSAPYCRLASDKSPLAVPGVSQVVVFGGDVRQYQVLVDPAKLRAFDVSLEDVTKAAQSANVNVPGGYLTNPDTELLIRGGTHFINCRIKTISNYIS